MMSMTGPRVAQEMTRTRSSEPGKVIAEGSFEEIQRFGDEELLQPLDIFDDEGVIGAEGFADFLRALRAVL